MEDGKKGGKIIAVLYIILDILPPESLVCI